MLGGLRSPLLCIPSPSVADFYLQGWLVTWQRWCYEIFIFSFVKVMLFLGLANTKAILFLLILTLFLPRFVTLR